MAPSPSDARRIRILLVDDDEDDYLLTREVVAEIVGGAYTLDWESDFDTALKRICASEHDIYLVDFWLGAKTGLDILREMRARQCSGPVILLTGVGQSEIDRAAAEAGAADFIEKGRLDAVILERSIRFALRQRAQEEELERKVVERTAELATANAALREADRRKDEFLATLAHELRNPLAPIRNALEIMRVAANNPDGVEKARLLVERQVGYMVRLIDDLLDASRITRNKLRIDLARLDLRNPVRAAAEAAQLQVDKAGLTLTVRLPESAVEVSGDNVRLAQVVSNLLANAVKFTDRGGAVTLTLKHSGSRAEVRVADTGVGIPAEVLPKLFEPFTQGEHTLSRSAGGLGIGLSLVKRLVEMHGGEVEARSDGVGRGAEFIFRLPTLTAIPDGERRQGLTER